MEKTPIEDYLEFLENYCEFLGTVAETQKQHLEALLTHDIPTIDASTARQQAVVMQLKSYEESRAKKQACAGLPSDLSLEDVAGRLGGEQAQALRRCLQTLRRATDQITFINDKIKQTVSTNLRVINLTVPIEQRKEAQRYFEDGKQEQPPESGFFGTKV